MERHVNSTKFAKVEYILTNDNAFVVLAGFQQAARLAGWTAKELNEVTATCLAGNYSQLICTLASYCDPHQ